MYALFDTQSDTILEETANILDPNSETATLRLSTMPARDNVIRYQKLRGIQVRGYDSDVFIDLPITYSRNFIPTDRSHIPTTNIAKEWPHLRRIAHLMNPMQNCEVGLLIGYNCPQALAPRSYITGEGNQPFAIQTDLGWSIVGGTDPYEGGDAIELLCETSNDPPKKGHVTSLVIKHCHEKVAHQGRGMTVNKVRSRGFWILGISSAV